MSFFSFLGQVEQAYGPLVRTLRDGEMFGELALLSDGAQRTATVVTRMPTDLLRMPKAR